MKNKEIVGIDVSKKGLDIYILSEKHHFVISNDPRGFAQMIEIYAMKLGNRLEHVFFCFEDTGRYSKLLYVFLQESKFQFAALNALDVKRSMGLTRGKNDKKDTG
jgi:transposase